MHLGSEGLHLAVVGAGVGAAVGAAMGAAAGVAVDDVVGAVVGDVVGAAVGDAMGEAVGVAPPELPVSSRGMRTLPKMPLIASGSRGESSTASLPGLDYLP
mgnify:CR=1 FL=1